MKYWYTCTSDVTYNGNNILSVLYTLDFFRGGGRTTTEYTGEVFDLETGGRLSLRDLFDRDDDSLLAIIKEQITSFVRNWDGDGPDDYTASVIAGYTLDNLEFYIATSGELTICIPRYELLPAQAGAPQIPCGLYIGRD